MRGGGVREEGRGGAGPKESWREAVDWRENGGEGGG